MLLKDSGVVDGERGKVVANARVGDDKIEMGDPLELNRVYGIDRIRLGFEISLTMMNLL